MDGTGAKCTVGAAVPPSRGGLARAPGHGSGGLRGLAGALAVVLMTAASGLRAQADPLEPPAAEAAQRAYSVRVDGPDLLLGRLLERDLDLLRWQDYRGMTRELLDRLVEEARGQLRETLATEGYFSPSVEAAIDGATEPWRVRFTIDPGPASRVRTVRVTLTGRITGEPSYAQARRERIEAEWALAVGERFRQSDWDDAKRRALATVRAERHAAARLAASRAEVDPESASVDLSIEIDSGPPFQLGPVRVVGLARYPESLVRNLAPFDGGEPYDAERLLLYQRRLAATGQFSAVQVEIDDDPAGAAAAPVRVSLLEASSRRIELGVGYSTDTLYRAQATWIDNDFAGRGWRWRSDARIEGRAARASSTMTLPAREDGWQDAGQVRYTQSDIAGLQQREGSAMFTRTAVDERRQPQWSLSAHLQNQKPDGAAGETVHAVFAAWRYTRRTTDDLLSPNRGSIASVQVGAAPPGLSTEGFVRGVAQAATWIPFGRDYTLVLRAEGGAVGARTTEGIPQSFLFRTGGDTTVRGYAFETLGVRQGSAIVGGRYQALLGVEAIRWVDERWGVAAFVDAGNAVAQAADLARLPWGAGLGARIRTPLGPVRADVAWGDATREVRLHLSLGVNF